MFIIFQSFSSVEKSFFALGFSSNLMNNFQMNIVKIYSCLGKTVMKQLSSNDPNWIP